MGCFQSRRLQKEEAVIRSKARRRYMKQVVKSRQSLSFYHSLYLHSLRSTGSALLQFSNAESPPPPPPPPPPTTTTHHDFPSPPPPPPPPMPPSPPLTPRWSPPPSAPPPQQQHHHQQQQPSSWDFWDPFAPSSSSHHPPPPPPADDDQSEDVATSTVSGSTLPPPPPPPPPSSMDSSKSELAMVVAPRVAKDFSEIVRELDEYFLKAAQAGNRVSALLQVPDPRFDYHHQPAAIGRFGGGYGRSLSTWGSGGGGGWSWRSNSRTRGFTRFEEESRAAAVGHSSTVEKIYAWEKKLYVEVKTSEMLREEHEKRAKILRKLEVKGVDYVKIEKNKRKIERLESKMMVASQAMETTSSEITKLRESELFPQLLELINGLMCMWSSMYECHQVQTHIVQQLEYLTASPSSNPTSDVHRQATLQLEIEVDRWYSSFCNLVKSQRDYIYSLTGWLRLCLFQSYHLIEPLAKSQKPSSSNIYSLCEQWQLALDRLPDKVASEGIKSLLTVIHAIILQQGEEQKQKKRSESAFKELEKRVNELRSLEAKYGPYSSTEGYGELSTRRMPVMDKKMKVDALKAKVEEEKAKYEKSSRVTRAMTINNLQTAFPNVFQAMTGFSSVCVQAFESVYNHQRDSHRAL